MWRKPSFQALALPHLWWEGRATQSNRQNGDLHLALGLMPVSQSQKQELSFQTKMANLNHGVLTRKASENI